MSSTFTRSEGHPAWCEHHLSDAGINLHVSAPVTLPVPAGQPLEVTVQQDANDPEVGPLLHIYNHGSGADELLDRDDANEVLDVLERALLSIRTLLLEVPSQREAVS